MTFEKRGDKWVFCNDGIYFALTWEQLKEINEITDNIIHEETADMLERVDIEFQPLPMPGAVSR